MGFNANTYGTNAGMYGQNLNYNSNANQQMMNLFGSGVGAAGSMLASPYKLF
jgi:hypothetical protein